MLNSFLSGGDLKYLRPLDCQGLHSLHGRGDQKLLPLQTGLPTHNLLHHCFLFRIQVTKNPWIPLLPKVFSRLCDSRNLNLSPFCNLSVSSLAKWQPTINSTYGDTRTNYTNKLEGPLRLKYPKVSWAERELLLSLTQVHLSKYLHSLLMIWYRVVIPTMPMKRI